MKKLLSTLLLITLLSTTACSTNNTASNTNSHTNTQATVSTENTTATNPATEENTNLSVKDKVKNTLEEFKFEGVFYLTQNGKEVYGMATGNTESDKPRTLDTVMPLGSISKQFCATAILQLRDQGKLSLEDTLSKYFPEYEIGKDITLKNLLTMRSGILDFINVIPTEEISPDNSEEDNIKIIKQGIFNQELYIEPDIEYDYSNSNFFLLANVVELVSGEKYIDYVRKNIFEPLGMKNSGSVDEIKGAPDWANGETYSSLMESEIIGLAKGAGDIISNVYDMDKWMTGLKSGKVISRESYEEMTTNYSPESAQEYGYGIMPGVHGGVGHSGHIGTYTSYECINEEQDYNMLISINSSDSSLVNDISAEVFEQIMK